MSVIYNVHYRNILPKNFIHSCKMKNNSMRMIFMLPYEVTYAFILEEDYGFATFTKLTYIFTNLLSFFTLVVT
jgi:hypothetical protein